MSTILAAALIKILRQVRLNRLVSKFLCSNSNITAGIVAVIRHHAVIHKTQTATIKKHQNTLIKHKANKEAEEDGGAQLTAIGHFQQQWLV